MSKFCLSCMEQHGDEFEVCPYCGYIEESEHEESLHIIPGNILNERYIIGKSIGFGGFGVTYIGFDALLEHKVAIKEYMPSEFSTRAMGEMKITVFGGKKEDQFHEGLKKFHEEAKKLARFNSEEGIVKVYDTFEENNTAYIVMELLEGETLAAYLEREKMVTVEQAINIILPIAESLRTVHAVGIIHRDISPDNIFLTKDKKIKLIDFGAARFATTSHSRSLSVLIKPGYSPEEQYRSRGDQGEYTDVYALGAVLYRMITGVVPSDALERRAFFENKKKDILVPISKYCKSISKDRQNAILNAMNVCIEDRTQSMDELIHELTTEEPVRRKQGKIKPLNFYTWPIWVKISIPAVAVLVVVLSALFALGIIGFKNNLQKNIYVPDGMARVPSVVNMGIDSAEKELNEVNLLYSIVGKEYSKEIPADMVLTQDIEGGSVVEQNTIINITMSGGAGEIAEGLMPDLQYQEEAVAIEMLKKYSVEPTITYEISETVKAGLVISQIPDAGTKLLEDTATTLIVSLGASTFELIDVTGMTEADAVQQLRDYNLQVTVEYTEGDADKNGMVLQQSISAGSQVRAGDVIVLTVSRNTDTELESDVNSIVEADTHVDEAPAEQAPSIILDKEEIVFVAGTNNMMDQKYLSYTTYPDNVEVTWKVDGYKCEDSRVYAGAVIYTESATVYEGDSYVDVNLKDADYIVLQGGDKGSITLTAEITVDGKKYSDSCKITTLFDYIFTDRICVDNGYPQKAFENLPSYASNIQYHSKDEAIATIDENGYVHGTSEGTTYVYAVFTYNGIECTISQEVFCSDIITFTENGEVINCDIGHQISFPEGLSYNMGCIDFEPSSETISFSNPSIFELTKCYFNEAGEYCIDTMENTEKNTEGFSFWANKVQNKTTPTYIFTAIASGSTDVTLTITFGEHTYVANYTIVVN